MGLFSVCCAELGSACAHRSIFVGVSGPQWEGHKGEDRQIIRSVDARETEVAGHFLLGLSSVLARCVFVVLSCFSVCVCVKVCYFLFWRFQHTAGGIRAVGWRGPQKTHLNCCENVPASWHGDETMLNFEFWCRRVDKLFFALFSLEQPCSL